MPDRSHLAPISREMVRELFTLSGGDALKRILEWDNPRHLVQYLSGVDFFWLIKKMGKDESLPLLRMASLDQWQYLLDMELWQRDRLSLENTSIWVGMLQQADQERLVKWLYGDGNLFAYYYLFKNIQVEIKMEDEVYDLADGFFTLDNLYYIRILDKDHEEVIGNILRQMANEDYDRYQALLLGLAGVIPAEVEEEMYRLRNVRLAEDGFLPVEEAISVYSYLKADSLKIDESSNKLHFPPAEEERELVPITPLIHAQGNNLLAESMSRFTDNRLLDRIRLEFAGLCNQILSAEGLRVDDLEILMHVYRRAAGYMNIGLERLTAGQIRLSEQYLKNNPLISIFRVGFGLALELKWEVDRWLNEAWFARQGFKPDFWGEEWGGTLAGILQKRPRLYGEFQEGKEYRDFEQLVEIEQCRTTLHRLIVLDRLLKIITGKYPFKRDGIIDPFLTFHPLFFNFWSRQLLKLDPGFATISIEQVRDFFRLIRARHSQPPYKMLGFKDVFIKNFVSYASDFEPDAARILKETLSILWQKFTEEYAWVAIADLDGRFTRFILSRPSS